jgi:hypothetical protein
MTPFPRARRDTPPLSSCRGEYEISFVGEEVRRDLHGALLRLEHPDEYHGATGHSRLLTVQSAATW